MPVVHYADHLSELQRRAASEENNFMGGKPGEAMNICLDVFLD